LKVNKKSYTSIWLKKNTQNVIQIIDQRHLPFRFIIEDLKSPEDICFAIKDMHLRGAPLIGVAGAFGVYLATLQARKKTNYNEHIILAAEKIKSSRPTAVNLFYAINRVLQTIESVKSIDEKIKLSKETCIKIRDKEIESCRQIGIKGFEIIKKLSEQKNGEVVNILTHCNAGWLACVDYGTALSPIYLAYDKKIKLHVWVDETRPRNQGAKLTAWELHQHGVPHTVIADNTGGHLMQHGLVDMVIVGSDRTTINGDVANKIGTYLKALAAKDNNIPFYVALPTSTIDKNIEDGINNIPIEIRDEDEVKYIEGFRNDEIQKVLLSNPNSPALNYGFDVTPARLITKLITENGICNPNKESILNIINK